MFYHICMNYAQINIITTDGIVISPAAVGKSADSQGIISNLLCFYIDQCDNRAYLRKNANFKCQIDSEYLIYIDNLSVPLRM